MPKGKISKKRERQIQFFKNLQKSSGGPGSLRSKVKKKSLLKKMKKSRRRGRRGKR